MDVYAKCWRVLRMNIAGKNNRYDLVASKDTGAGVLGRHVLRFGKGWPKFMQGQVFCYLEDQGGMCDTIPSKSGRYTCKFNADRCREKMRIMVRSIYSFDAWLTDSPSMSISFTTVRGLYNLGRYADTMKQMGKLVEIGCGIIRESKEMK